MRAAIQAAPRQCSNEREGSWGTVDSVGTASEQVFDGQCRGIGRLRRRRDDQLEGGRDGADAEQPAALAGKAVVVWSGLAVIQTIVTMDRDLAQALMLTISDDNTVGWRGTVAEGKGSRRRQQAQRIKGDQNGRRSFAPKVGKFDQHASD